MIYFIIIITIILLFIIGRSISNLHQCSIVHISAGTWQGADYKFSTGYAIKRSSFLFDSWHGTWESDGNGDGWVVVYSFKSVDECRRCIKEIQDGQRPWINDGPQTVFRIIE